MIPFSCLHSPVFHASGLRQENEDKRIGFSCFPRASGCLSLGSCGARRGHSERVRESWRSISRALSERSTWSIAYPGFAQLSGNAVKQSCRCRKGVGREGLAPRASLYPRRASPNFPTLRTSLGMHTTPSRREVRRRWRVVCSQVFSRRTFPTYIPPLAQKLLHLR